MKNALRAHVKRIQKGYGYAIKMHFQCYYLAVIVT